MRTRAANPWFRGTGCGKSARPGLWGSRRVTGGYTRKQVQRIKFFPQQINQTLTIIQRFSSIGFAWFRTGRLGCGRIHTPIGR